MSNDSTRRMIAAYIETAPAPMFLSGFFQSRPENFHNSEEVEIDVQRETEDVAIVIQDLKAGARLNESGKYTNKSFPPPTFLEEGVISAYDLTKRQPGEDPFQTLDFQATATKKAFGIARKLENKVRRAVELEVAQVLTTGELTLIDSAGIALFTLDFQPKSTHFATPTAWAADGSTGDPLLNLFDHAALLRRNGRKSPDRLVFGAGAWLRFMANAKVNAQLDNMGKQGFQSILPSIPNADGASFMGYIFVGNYRFEMWLYDGQYTHPQTGVTTPYIADNKVLMMSSKSRFDMTWGAIPRIGSVEQSAMPYLPSRISGPGLDLSPWAYRSADGRNLMIQVGSRPLPIPTEIDTFGCLTVY